MATPQQAAAKGKGWVDKNNPNYGKAGFIGAEDEDDYVAPAPAAPAPATPTPAAPAPASPIPAATPSAPKPGPDWVPTPDGKGWVPPTHPLAAPAPAAPTPAAPAPAAPPTPASGGVMGAPAPNLGPQVYDPATGTASHDPSQNVLPVPIDNGGESVPIDPGTTPDAGINPRFKRPGDGSDSGWGGAPPGKAPTTGRGPLGQPPVGNEPPPGRETMTGRPAAPTVDSAFKDSLLKMLGQNQADPTLTDPALKAQSEAFSLQQTRAKERAREALAERRGANAEAGGAGVNSGGFDQDLVGLEQAQGEATGAHDAGLLSNELQQRRSQLMQAAALAGNTLDNESRLAMQKQLADVDAEIRRTGMAQQGSQFDKSLAQSGGQFEQSLALDSRRVDEASKQWGQQFGLEGQKLAEGMRQFDTTTAAGRDQLKQQMEMFKQTQAQQGKQFDVDAELKRLGINQQSDLGRGDLDLRRFLGEGNMNLGLLSALMQNQQFGQGLGAQLGMFNSGQNNNLLQSLLGALGQAQ